MLTLNGQTALDRKRIPTYITLCLLSIEKKNIKSHRTFKSESKFPWWCCCFKGEIFHYICWVCL